MRPFVLVCLALLCLRGTAAAQPNAQELVRIADTKRRGKSSLSALTMTIHRPNWSRGVSLKSWSLGTEYNLILITAPAKEKGQAFLKRKTEMWNYVPAIDRIIKLPPSMMSQSWMGSDFTNDDLLKESSLVKDYTHTLIGEEKTDGFTCWKIEMRPRENAAVVWGRLLMWIDRETENIVRVERYDEDDELMSTELADEIKMMDGRNIPTHIKIVPADKQGHFTELRIESMAFGIDISEQSFSQQKMKRAR